MPRALILKEDTTGRAGITVREDIIAKVFTMEREAITDKAGITVKVDIIVREDIVRIVKAGTTGRAGIIVKEGTTADM